MKLKNKKICIFFVMIIVSINSYDALKYELSDEMDAFYKEGDQLCANTPLNLKTDAQIVEMKVVDKNTNVILESQTFGKYNNEISFPTYENPIFIYLQSFDPETMKPIEQVKIDTSIKECDATNIEKAPYDLKAPMTVIKLESNNLTFTKNDEALKNTFYQSIDLELFGDAKYKDEKSKTIDITGYDTIQFAETKLVDGNEVTDYFELLVNEDSTFEIRAVKGFDLQVIKLQQMIDVSSLALATACFVLSYVCLLLSRKYGKRYKRHRRNELKNKKIRSRK